MIGVFLDEAQDTYLQMERGGLKWAKFPSPGWRFVVAINSQNTINTKSKQL